MEDLGYIIYILMVSFIAIYFIVKQYVFEKNILKRKISNSNKIRFTKLKQFLNESTESDILDLISYLFKNLKERKKYENKKSNNKK